MLRQRFIAGVSSVIILGAAVSADIFLKKYLFFNLFISLCAVLCVIEFCGLLKKSGGMAPPVPVLVFFSALVPLMMTLMIHKERMNQGIILLLPLFILFMLTLLLYQWRSGDRESYLLNTGMACVTFCLISLPAVSLILIPTLAGGEEVKHGCFAVFATILTVKMYDIGAYAGGKNFGRTKIFPVLSPKKSLEGCISGVIFSIIAALLLCVVFDRLFPVHIAVLFGVVASVIGQAGDLAESAIKRNLKIKDSGSSIPGFGGVLDLVDSILGFAPISLLFFLF